MAKLSWNDFLPRHPKRVLCRVVVPVISRKLDSNGLKLPSIYQLLQKELAGLTGDWASMSVALKVNTTPQRKGQKRPKAPRRQVCSFLIAEKADLQTLQKKFGLSRVTPDATLGQTPVAAFAIHLSATAIPALYAAHGFKL